MNDDGLHISERPTSELTDRDYPSCSFCGAPTLPSGSCFTCPRCGETTGCS